MTNRQTRNISLFLSMVIAVNMTGFSALATDKTINKAHSKIIDDSLIDQSIRAQNNELKSSLNQVKALIKSIEAYRAGLDDEKSNTFLNAARLIVTVLGVSNAVLHFNNKKVESSSELTLAAVMGALSAVLEKYISTQKIDMDEVKELIAKNQQYLINDIDKVGEEDGVLIVDAIRQLSQISDSINDKMNNIKSYIDNGQTDAAIVATITLVLNYVAAFLPQKLKQTVSNKAPALLGRAAHTKKLGVQGLAVSNIAPVLSTIAGMAGKNSKQQLDSILANLRITQANLTAALNKN